MSSATFTAQEWKKSVLSVRRLALALIMSFRSVPSVEIVMLEKLDCTI